MTDIDRLPNPSSLAFVEQLYADYVQDPASVSDDWRRYFQETVGTGNGASAQTGPSFTPQRLFGAPMAAETNAPPPATPGANVNQLMKAYRTMGHLRASLDPLGQARPTHPELELSYHGLEQADLGKTFPNPGIVGPSTMPLQGIVERLQNTYCRSIGVQYMHIEDLEVQRWLTERMEATENRTVLTRDEQVRILTRLNEATLFEEFIQKKYLGAKSFSLEGAESVIPMLDLAIEKAGEQGIDAVVLGMAHRGRLNVLANIMGKSPRAIFREFDDSDPEMFFGSGDVKYHLGHSSDWQTASGKSVHLTLCFNPSHLEIVSPVVLGRVRARQDRGGDVERNRQLAVIIHGDAAFAGEGVVQETLNLSELGGYHVGGALHVIINNQIGFTTSPDKSRSSLYATDVAKMLQIPIFHVNGEDPEAVAQVVRLAMDFRHTFQRDVVIDLYAFRRLGHNEGDEPAYTQPMMYANIAKRKSVREHYLDRLLALGGVTAEQADQIETQCRERLEAELQEARKPGFKRHMPWLGGVWEGYNGGPEPTGDDPETGVAKDTLAQIMAKQAEVPAGFTPHPKVKRLLETRAQQASGDKPLDWAAGEALALATLASSGVRVRLTGQDAERGTFSHRHSVLHDVKDGQELMLLNHLQATQGPIEIVNSPLSEMGVLGFEYGYSLDCPDGLVIWEAQFGDFVNVAQPIIDQFICSAEDKWKRLSGLVMLLPHGMEGQGPEHSSARLERFLQLAAHDNMQIVQPTTPAQMFHLLRRQVLRAWRKPLIVMTPKSLLRHPAAISSLDDLATGRFQRVIPDTTATPAAVERILICSGKNYYELDKQRTERGLQNVAIVRLEQFYPFPEDALRQTLAVYKDGTPVFWVQDEPSNQGAWWFLKVRIGDTLFGRFPFSGICRDEATSPASGSLNAHRLEEKRLLEQVFANIKEVTHSHDR
jgi:2-oxoglutarate dehydrogenase E1 component